MRTEDPGVLKKLPFQKFLFLGVVVALSFYAMPLGFLLPFLPAFFFFPTNPGIPVFGPAFG